MRSMYQNGITVLNKKRVTVILVPNFFKISSENNPPINSYHAPVGFGKASTPAAEATPHNAIELKPGPSTRKSDV